MSQLKAYPEYKDSGVEWVGEIPEEWEVIKLKNIGYFSSSGINKKIEEYLHLIKIINYTDVYGNKSLKLKNHDDYMKVTATEKQISKHTLKEGDLIFTPSSETTDDIGVSSLVYEDLDNTCFSYHVLRFQFSKEIDKEYKKYLCNNHYVLNKFSSLATGSIRKTLNRNDFKNTEVILPTLYEQRKISSFLDKKSKNINSLIKNKERLIELLEEKRQSVITEIVTKGLDPDVKMKDSGIEWIGDIPEHWEVKKIKYLFNEKNKRNTDDTEVLLSLYTSIGVRPRSDMVQKGNKSQTIQNYKIVEPGDIVVNKLLAWMGSIGISDYKGVTSPDYDVYRAKDSEKVNSLYYHYYFRNHYFKGDCYKFGRGIMLMRWRTYPEEFKRIKILHPPIVEQNLIIERIHDYSESIVKSIEIIKNQISKLKEYRESLIYEAVTGKIDVRDYSVEKEEVY